MIDLAARIFVLTGAAALLFVLYRERLLIRYRALAAYLAFGFAAASILLPIDYSSRLFYWVYSVAEPILWVLQYLVVVELFSISFLLYPGIRLAIKIVQIAALLGAILIGRLSFVHREGHWVMQSIHRSVTIAELAFLVLLFVAIIALPIKLSRNARRCVVGFGFSFGVDIALLFLARANNIDQLNFFSRIRLLISGAVYFWLALAF